jgi:hypothetical protein
MELDDLKAAWATHGTMLERSLAINERLLREVMLRKVRARLARYVVWRGLEVALGLVALLAVISVVAHVAEPRYLGVGGPLAVFVATTTAMSAYLLVRAAQLDHGGPVTVIQRAVERMRGVEYRALKWAVLGGVVFWLPLGLVVFEAVTGVAALGRVDLAWLVANLAFGLGVLAVGQAASKTYLERAELAPWARRLVDAISGRALRAAAAHLAELATFERDAGDSP